MKLHLASSFPQKFIAIVCKSVYMDVYKCTNVSNVWSLLNPNTCADLSHPSGNFKRSHSKYIDGDIQRTSAEFMLRYRGKVENAGIHE